MGILNIAHILGAMLTVFSLVFVPPAIVAAIYSEPLVPYIFSMLATFGLGIALYLVSYRASYKLRTRDGFLVTILFWVALSVAGSLPFTLESGLNLSLIDGLFESTSGLTTTGSTVLSGLDNMQRSILFYRQFLQWIGGVGVVMIALAVLPAISPGASQLYRTAAVGHAKEEKFASNIHSTVKALFNIYLGLTIACILGYIWAGMSVFDAISFAFSTVSIGGFAPYDASMAQFADNPAVLAVCITFIIISGMNFGLHFIALTQAKFRQYMQDNETRFYCLILCLAVLFTIGTLYNNIYQSKDVLLHALQAISLVTTTGFTTGVYHQWPDYLWVAGMLCACFGACAGSVGGGIKMGRVLFIIKHCFNEVCRFVHPNGVFSLKMNTSPVSSWYASSIWSFFSLYLGVSLIGMVLLMSTGLNLETAWGAVCATLNNLGPGFGSVSQNYSDLNSAAKILLCGSMLLGRLEIFTLVIVLSPIFWRR